MKLLTATILAATAAVTLSAPADAASLVGRQRNQIHRTRQGSANGEINRNEARSLTTHQRKIHSQIVRDRVDGQGFTARERARANRALDRQSKRIYTSRHNGR